ncbi:hypothetical protein OPV22_014739 [Ensete ventricosum]|uniref:Uncharacterized protein n=1 Tax=Ensete ventricosum TaxID=4639 RepID=A0AAV8RAB6_ENSVE|nr:hypothetical protein OPV22_014739 [Ensete ventricosum]
MGGGDVWIQKPACTHCKTHRKDTVKKTTTKRQKPSTASLINRHPYPRPDSVSRSPTFYSSELAKGEEKRHELGHSCSAGSEAGHGQARCSHEGVVAGAKAAVVATVAAAVPTLASVKMLPWARSNLNPTAQALIISTVAGAA